MGKVALTTFPYHKTPDGKFFPIIPLKLSHKRKTTDTSALVDSGATISIFRPEVAGKKFVCPMIFSYEFTVSFNLLGREKLFENFVIVFDEKKKEVRLD